MKYPILIAAVILVSACVQLSGFFGQDVLTINRKVSEEGFKDIIAVKDARSIPSSPVLPSQQILFSFIVENVDKTETAKGVVVDLFNAPLFKDVQQKQLCNLRACLPDFCGKGNPCSVLPGEQRAINFELLAPNEEEIARIKTDTELSYKASYDFQGKLLYSVPVVNQEEIRSLQRQGKSVSLTEQITHGSGPLQIDVQLFGTPYLLSDFKGIFIFTVKNKGKGNVVNSRIEPKKLIIELPLDMFTDEAILITPGDVAYGKLGTRFSGTETNPITGNVVSFSSHTGKNILCINRQTNTYQCRDDCLSGEGQIASYATEADCLQEQNSRAGQAVIDITNIYPQKQAQQECKPLFTCTSTVSEDVSPFQIGVPLTKREVFRCVNNCPINLFRDETRTTMRFEISKVARISEPFKTYLIRAWVDYKYELRDSFPITIRPFEK